MADEKNPRFLPSSFQQILENMKYVNLLKETIFNPDWNKPDPEPDDPVSDVVMDVDTTTMKVIGISLVLENRDKDLAPSTYIRDITYELKNSEVIGVKEKVGVTLDYVLLMTVNMHQTKADDDESTDEVIDYPAWQCAYGDNAMEMYYRKANDDDTWGEWVNVIDGQIFNYLQTGEWLTKVDINEIFNNIDINEFFDKLGSADWDEIINQIDWENVNFTVLGKLIGKILDTIDWDNPNLDFSQLTKFVQNLIENNETLATLLAHRQIVQSETQPTDQINGDYWFEPIHDSEFFMQSVDDPSQTIELGEDSVGDFKMGEVGSDELTDTGNRDQFSIESLENTTSEGG